MGRGAWSMGMIFCSEIRTALPGLQKYIYIHISSPTLIVLPHLFEPS
jgi:hypothetical protein